MRVGDHVHWTYMSQKGRSISMSRRDGEITAIHGDTATVKRPSGRSQTVRLTWLHPLDAPSQITEFVEAIRGGAHNANC